MPCQLCVGRDRFRGDDVWYKHQRVATGNVHRVNRRDYARHVDGLDKKSEWEDVTSAENIFSRSSLVAAHSVRWRAPGPVFWPVRAILDRRAKD